MHGMAWEQIVEDDGNVLNEMIAKLVAAKLIGSPDNHEVSL